MSSFIFLCDMLSKGLFAVVILNKSVNIFLPQVMLLHYTTPIIFGISVYQN